MPKSLSHETYPRLERTRLFNRSSHLCCAAYNSLLTMTEETLAKANALQQKIREFKMALLCFEEEYEGLVIDKTPRLILDFDDLDDGRDQVKIPMALNASLIEFLKEEIRDGLTQAKIDFLNL